MGVLYLLEETNDFWLVRCVRLCIIFTVLKHFPNYTKTKYHFEKMLCENFFKYLVLRFTKP
jgi:hypothetical protein